MINCVASKLKNLFIHKRVPATVKHEVSKDHLSNLPEDPGIHLVVKACAKWLTYAQDNSSSFDGGVARHYSLIDGWGESYPETTGYIVPTMIQLSNELGDDVYLKRAQRMLDWLVSIQMPGGGFQGGTINAEPVVPVTFNTGQILLGLVSGFCTFGFERYAEAMHKAAVFLRDSLDPDGCWRKHSTPFAKPGEKTYETHVAWGLFEAERVSSGLGYAEAGIRQVDWALTKQYPNGWVEDCCLEDKSAPLTHTLGYFLRGVLEAYSYNQDEKFLNASKRTAEALIHVQREDGALPGRLRHDWSPAVKWTCITGNSQIAECWLKLYEWTGEKKYLRSAQKINSFVRRTVRVEGPEDILGGVKGSYPIDGEYGQFQYLNWAAKFTIDANIAEIKVNRGCLLSGGPYSLKLF